ncbi:Uncharacterized membrane protein YsdA, DUF1294 family [Litoreibacter ascidiaceicola]|uniref:Uncharacterized membrane protein YsdA, DUF1294 family n=1 Tax=Litoreibacter ascidiaceicola TaxID=1486859 RepID=A0A1M5B4Y2_9RHOB|nr:DUF1294 domain-containing protein [Litoreibacter ascidiaceicola]SHF37564.1 Uncharacterized membrane protein YsdA, DUF1294 family [Litoreibacter ascidiaceicola]
MPDSLLPMAIAAAYLALVNLVTYILFAFDKRRARVRGRRISESNLLLWSAVGGTPAAKLAQKRLRHKTVKQPFARQLNAIIWVQILIVVFIAFPQVRALLWQALTFVKGLF